MIFLKKKKLTADKLVSVYICNKMFY